MLDDQRIEEIAKRHARRIETYVLDDGAVENGEWDGVQQVVSAAMREALSSQGRGVCDECGEPLEPPQATRYHRECDLKRHEAKEEELRSWKAKTEHIARDYESADAELRSLREERDEAMEVLSGGRLYGPDASGELQERPTTLLGRAVNVASAAETEADIVDEIRSERETAKARAESAEAELRQLREERDAYQFDAMTHEVELQRLREGMRALPRYNCDCLPNDPTDTRMATDDEAMTVDCINCERWIVLAEDLDRLLASPVEEKVT